MSTVAVSTPVASERVATDDMCARLSPIAYEHINFLGRYAFTRADSGAGLRPFHDPTQEADAPGAPMAAPTL
ncbi:MULTISPECIES: Tn3 family transposase [unclassified Streptomyces]|uniref:Tn3 family transposase n=1 Tax=unclassified Streptomyces TaxID=2593676 RepID=UPI001BE79B6C|nr:MULTISPECIES: Tn3 family transposase [unclassified Streptomyces]MBT2407338.1 hypothetical protein [Streptomyces sp. ISL-21]MBT2609720.1 hypothetical protein [Streptomyces sp. ISL-87]